MKRHQKQAGGETCREIEGEAGEADLVAPTLERSQHDTIEELGKQIADVDGRISRPWRSVDLLATMERRGTITREMRIAGEEFRSRFNTAHLHGVQAMDLTKPMVSNGSYRHQPARSAVESAKADVWHAVMAVGGPGSPAGSCIWNCVGWEMSLRQWALERGWSGRMTSEKAASGILVAALGVLELFYREEGKK